MFLERKLNVTGAVSGDNIDIYQAFDGREKSFQYRDDFLLDQLGRSIGPVVTDGEIIG